MLGVSARVEGGTLALYVCGELHGVYAVALAGELRQLATDVALGAAQAQMAHGDGVVLPSAGDEPFGELERALLARLRERRRVDRR